MFNANGDYQISKDAKMWLFLLYDVPSVDANGNATAYNRKSLKVSNISTSISNVSEVIKKSTIRQFIEAGILEDNGYDEVLLAMPIIDAIDKLDSLIKADNSK